MRTSQRAIDTHALPWQPVAEHLERKLLNGSPQEGAHTLLLRSAPRAPGPAFAQYHPIDEELFCLDGDFTFDGSTWFHGGSYAFYPAYFVHGANVHVRGGYFVYLRLSGTNELFRVEEPRSHVPYFVGEGEPGARALQFSDAAAAIAASDILAGAALRATPLRRDAASGGGSTLLTAAPEAAGQRVELASIGLLEVFALSGMFEVADGARLGSHGYHCEVGDSPVIALGCREAGTLVVSHDGPLHVGAAAGSAPDAITRNQGVNS